MATLADLSPVIAQRWNQRDTRLANPDEVLLRLLRLTETDLTALEAATTDTVLLDTLLRTLDCSPYLSEFLIGEPSILDWISSNIGVEWHREELRDDLNTRLDETGKLSDGRRESLETLSQFHRSHLLRIGMGDLGGTINLETVTSELSWLADVTIDAVLKLQWSEMVQQYGVPMTSQELPANLAVVGLGKLGGTELNFRSDIDIIFVYDDEGEATGGESAKKLSTHEWFIRLCEKVVETLTEPRSSGWLYRVDTRLRPDGNSGSLARSLAAFEAYYQSRGELWERQMLIKARTVAGSLPVGDLFVDMVRPFSYRREMRGSPKAEIHRVAQAIQAKLLGQNRYGEMREERHVKLRRGGLRDIEFIVQCLQLVIGGFDVQVRARNTLHAIAALKERGILESWEAEILARIYRRIRLVEHRLQMVSGRQQFLLPESEAEYATLAAAMNEEPSQLKMLLETDRKAVRTIYDDVLGTRAHIAGIGEILLDADPDSLDSATLGHLKFAGLLHHKEALKNLKLLADSGSHARDSVKRLIPPLLEQLSKSPAPDRGLRNLTEVLRAFGAIESFSDLLASHRGFLEILVTLCGSSQSLADTLIRDPSLLDWMVSSGILTGDRTPVEISLALRANLASLGSDQEEWRRVLHTYRKRETMRVGLRYLLGLDERHATTSGLTSVAEAVVSQAWKNAEKEVFDRMGTPYGPEGEPAAGVALAMGKFGSTDLNFGSDLDLVFVYSEDGVSDTGLDNHTIFVLVARKVMAELGEPTRYGTLYEVDARLRPEGKSAPLAIALEGYVAYMERRADTWERQAMTRFRPVAGDLAFGERVIDTLAKLVYRPLTKLVWQEIYEMRARIQSDGEKKYGNRINIKTGRGGLMDADFLAQTSQLRGGAQDVDLRGMGTRAVICRLSEDWKVDPALVQETVHAYDLIRNVQVALRIQDEKARNVLPDSAEEWTVLSRHLQLERSELPQSVIEESMEKLRAGYESIMGTLQEGLPE